MGLLTRVQNYQKQQLQQTALPKTGEVLDRSAQLHTQPLTSETYSDHSQQSILSTILKKIGNIEQSIDAPYLAFEVLCNTLQDFEGIFFLSDHEAFIPISSCHSDLPSAQRIPKKEIYKTDSVQLLKEKAYIEKWEVFLPSLPEKLLILNCGEQEGLLLVSGGSIFTSSDESILFTGEMLANAFRNMIREAAIIRDISFQSLPKKDNFLQTFREKAGANSFVVSFAREQLFQIFTKIAPHARRASIEQDVLGILSTIVQEDGLVTLDEEHFHTFFFDIDVPENIFICQQLQTSLQHAFSAQLHKLKFSITNPDRILANTYQQP